jgi:hypothetical protein
MARLNSYVHCYKDGKTHVFGPDDTVPDWARKQIRRPDVWDDKAELADETGHNAHVHFAPDAEGDGPPPQGGPGASRQKWVDYATPLLAKKGVEVQADWKREDIIAACETAGVPV